MKLKTFLILFCLIISACGKSPRPAPTPTATPTFVSSQTATPIIYPTNTATLTPSLSVVHLESSIESPTFSYQTACIDVLRPDANEFKKSLQELLLSGTAVFNDYSNSSIVFFDLATGEKHTIPENPALDSWADMPEVSPDGKWLFYLSGRGNSLMGDANLVLSNSQGIELKTFPVSTVKEHGFSYQFVHDWLGNESLRLLSKKDYQDDDLVILLLNPFSEEITHLKNDFQGMQPPILKAAISIRENPKYFDWGIDPFFEVIGLQLKGANVAYSPDKNLAFYPHKDGHDILYDVRNQKELAHVSIPNWGELPRWSTSGDSISIIAMPSNYSQEHAKRDFYLLSNDGKTLKRLTYLSEQFERVSIKEYSWSPDGTKIAFWLSTNFPTTDDEAVLYELAILDIKSGIVTNLCIQDPSVTVEELAEHAGFLVEPIWAQDSNSLLIKIHSVEKSWPDFSTEAILVVPSKLSALVVMKDADPKGWMIDSHDALPE